MQSTASTRRALAALILVLTAAPAFAAGPRKTPAKNGDLTGVWTGTLTLDGLPRVVAIELDQRADGRVMGYMPGGTSAWTVLSGRLAGKHVDLLLEQRSLAGVRTLSFDGSLDGKKKLKGDLSDGSIGQKVTFNLVEGPVVERRFLFAAVDASGSPTSLNELAVALDGAGSLVAGAFVGQNDCRLWSCEGVVTSFMETGGTLGLGFSAPGGCAAGSSVALLFDSVAKLYSGTYVQNTCSGPRSGNILAARTSRTNSADVAQVLAALDRLADDFEGGAPLIPPHPSFSPSYVDAGLTLADLLEDYSAEIASHGSIQASFNRLRLVHTVPDPDSFPDVTPAVGAVFEELRSGIPAGGTLPVTYVDSFATGAPSKLRDWANEGGHWVIRGDGAPPLDFPFANTVTIDALGVRRLEALTNGGLDRVYVNVSPFGAHFEPLTGHAYGDGKGNLTGFFTRDDSDLTVLSPTLRAYFGGPGGSLLLQRRPLYVAPRDATLRSVSCVTPAPGLYFLNQGQWSLEIDFAGGDGLNIGHVGEIHPDLRTKIFAAAGVSTTTCSSPGAGNLLGAATIPLAQGEAIAWPQVPARQVAAGYFVGNGTVADRPWAQMEFFYFGPVGSESADRCFYAALARSKQRDLQTMLVGDMADPMSQLFRAPLFQSAKWRWTAESRLCMAPSRVPRDFSDLYTDLGGWFETDSPTIASDEIVAFAPVAKDTLAYDPARYDSPAVSMLVTRRHASGGVFHWVLPGSALQQVVSPPHGEILERTPDTLLVKWRDLQAPGGTSFYQRATYALDATGLKINWSGTLVASAAAAVAPGSAGGVPCDGTLVVCYDHTLHTGY